MKDGTLYAGRLKKAFGRLKTPKVESDASTPTEPIHCLALGVLGSDGGPGRAERQLKKALGIVVDWNEIRVSNAQEVSDLLGDGSAEGLRRSQNLIDALQAIYDRENKVSLDRLKSLGRREARQYLESLKGVDEYAAAYVILWAFGGHAIPVWNQVLDGLREAQLVHPQASRAEIQAFLERNVSAADAKSFSLAVSDLATGRGGAPAKKSPPAKARKRAAAKGK